MKVSSINKRPDLFKILNKWKASDLDFLQLESFMKDV